jgi:chemotaxis-related protein WspD
VAADRNELDFPLPVVDDCWNRIGVRGDHSCPELPAVIHCHNCPVFARAGQRLFDRPPPPECIDEWTAQLAHQEAGETGDVLAFIVFRVGAEWLAFDVQAMVEVAEPRPFHRVPHRRDRVLLGIANIRGELQLCLSLRDLLGIEAGEPGASATGAGTARRTGWLLVTEHEGRQLALAVDEVAGVWRVPRVAVGKAPATVTGSQSSAARGVFVREDRRVGCLDADQLFDLIRRHLE